jgi:hypothetical protein
VLQSRSRQELRNFSWPEPLSYIASAQTAPAQTFTVYSTRSLMYRRV